jgi:L-amino acid N-acyltransferase YncA
VQLERVQKEEGVVISPTGEKHWPSVREIYHAGIDTGHATFESSPARDLGEVTGASYR